MMHETDITYYELPPTGITLLGYIVRRMHKTQWLTPVHDLLAIGNTEEILARIALYTVTASTSYGKAYYQPRFNLAGDEIAEADPITGAEVLARLHTSSPTYKISYAVDLADGGSFTGNEEITGTKLSLRGLGMPAPSKFIFRSGEYVVELTGILTSELVISLIRPTRIRAYGFLNFEDNAGNTGRLNINRDQRIELIINAKAWNAAGPFSVERATA
jgi:hypothetical protein